MNFVQFVLWLAAGLGSPINDADVKTFTGNSMMYYASLRQLEIIGEAANHLSMEIHLDFPEVPWARIIGLRNLVIHEYFGV